MGSPAELYENPNSVFVAGFVGSSRMNVLTGVFAKAANGATLGVRSEHIEIGEGGRWQGKVMHAEDPGSDDCLFVDIGAEQALIVRRPGKRQIAEGTTVSLNPLHMHRFYVAEAPIH